MKQSSSMRAQRPCPAQLSAEASHEGEQKVFNPTVPSESLVTSTSVAPTENRVSAGSSVESESSAQHLPVLHLESVVSKLSRAQQRCWKEVTSSVEEFRVPEDFPWQVFDDKAFVKNLQNVRHFFSREVDDNIVFISKGSNSVYSGSKDRAEDQDQKLLLWTSESRTRVPKPTGIENCFFQFERLGAVENRCCANSSRPPFASGWEDRRQDIFGYVWNNGVKGKSFCHEDLPIATEKGRRVLLYSQEYTASNSKRDFPSTVKQPSAHDFMTQCKSRLWMRNFQPAEFPAVLAGRVCKFFGARKTLDFCVGWGNRLFGAYLAGCDYIGIDSNVHLKAPFEEFAKLLSAQNSDAAKGIGVSMIFKKVEDVVLEGVDAIDADCELTCLNWSSASLADYDLVFTSPPWWNRNGGNNMACMNEGYRCAERDYDAFMGNALIPAMKHCLAQRLPEGARKFVPVSPSILAAIQPNTASVSGSGAKRNGVTESLADESGEIMVYSTVWVCLYVNPEMKEDLVSTFGEPKISLPFKTQGGKWQHIYCWNSTAKLDATARWSANNSSVSMKEKRKVNVELNGMKRRRTVKEHGS